MSVTDKLSAGAYEVKQVDGMTSEELQKEKQRLVEAFGNDLAAEFGIQKHPKHEKLFLTAWKLGDELCDSKSSYQQRLWEVFWSYRMLAELIFNEMGVSKE